ncbi:MAG: hypothetical protein RL732_212 [Bacteroidota bacterium]
MKSTALHNPYVPFSIPLLHAMARQPLYLVRQHYPRGADPTSVKCTTPLLLTHYTQLDTDRERAQRHMRLLKKDPCRFLYDSTDAVHRERLESAAAQPEGYRIYINLLPAPWKAPAPLKKKIEAYLREQLHWWNYRPNDTLHVALKDRYGELFLGISWKHRQTEVHLADIENHRPCAMT